MNSLQPFLLRNIGVCSSAIGKSYMNTRFFYRKRNGMYFCSIVLKRKRKPANKKSSVFLKKISKIRFDILCITFKPPEMPVLKVVI